MSPKTAGQKQYKVYPILTALSTKIGSVQTALIPVIRVAAKLTCGGLAHLFAANKF
jgi:hypothetical protein